MENLKKKKDKLHRKDIWILELMEKNIRLEIPKKIITIFF